MEDQQSFALSDGFPEFRLERFEHEFLDPVKEDGFVESGFIGQAVDHRWIRAVRFCVLRAFLSGREMRICRVVLFSRSLTVD
jgi:hypothetical protein